VLQNGVRRLAGKLGDKPYAAGILVEARVEEGRKGFKTAPAARILGLPAWKIGMKMKAFNT
jgi:hypothetical protein